MQSPLSRHPGPDSRAFWLRLSFHSLSTLARLLILSLAASAFAQPSAPYGYSLSGEPVEQLAAPGTPAIVLFFTATDCPISNRYIPEIQNLEKDFTAHRVTLWYVYANAGETAVGIRQHELAYGAEEHVLLDRRHRLVALTGARITPEVAVLIPSTSGFRVVYRGRIDNRYIHFGVQRRQATQHDLAQAVADVLAHRSVHQPDGPPVGCTIIDEP